MTQGKDANHLNITIQETPKSKKDEGDFTSAELMISIGVAGEMMAKSEGAPERPTTQFEKVAHLYTLLCESLANSKPKGGFAVKHYVPYFVALGQAGHTEALVARVWRSRSLTGLSEWAESHPEKVRALGAWSGGYAWRER